MQANGYTDDDDFTRGLGDGDAFGYPGQEPNLPSTHFDPQAKHADWVIVPIETELHWSEREALGYKAIKKEWVEGDSDNKPGDAEQAGWDDVAG